MQFFFESPRQRAVRYVLEAVAEPGLLPRVLQPFARRDLVPDRLVARRHGERVQVEIFLAAMPSDMIHVVEGNLRQLVGAIRIEVELQVRARAA